MQQLATFYWDSIPNGKLLNKSKMEAPADDIFKVAQMLENVFDWLENIVRNAGYQHYLILPLWFQKLKI